ncbi:hypothetical protein [Kineococcus sp. SYSU DK006]|uniref:hypothetical protein n=1 Tax=Kineococcus sp. SYSU DK006 TaxID=3383127 RepID=UPI003D7DADDA
MQPRTPAAPQLLEQLWQRVAEGFARLASSRWVAAVIGGLLLQAAGARGAARRCWSGSSTGC